jgi:hypothetical protein
MTLKQKKYLVLFLGMLAVAIFGVWMWVRMPNLREIVVMMELVNCGGCAAVLGLFRASRQRAAAKQTPLPYRE